MLAKITTPNRWNQNNNNTSWEDLWELVLTGSRDDLSRLYCYTYACLFKYGYNIYPDKALIKDCIQELFLNIWAKRESLNKANSVKSYLFSSLRRVILRRLQKKRNRAERNLQYTQNSFEEMVNIEKLMIHFETESWKKKQMIEALNILSERQKEAVYLKFYSGLSNDEISQIMDVNKQSVYNHISKAISRMQNFIQA